MNAALEHYDLALIALYAFWIFFAALVLYLNREGMREGYPVESETTGKPLGSGIIGLPEPKTFLLQDGTEVTAPHPEDYDYPINAAPLEKWSGAPLEPLGDPMLSEFGPSAYAHRIDKPLLTHTNELKIQPLRRLPEFEIVNSDQDPRGLPVFAGDNLEAGSVVDVWIDKEEQLIRYLEVKLAGSDPTPRHVLVPMTMAVVGGRWASLGVWRPVVKVRSILSTHFPHVPVTAQPDQVTLLEEDKITAFFGGGTLYATTERRETLI
ncbi:MAG: photosynthetic reaction center subunit H [Pseudomonadota bacterium]